MTLNIAWQEQPDKPGKWLYIGHPSSHNPSMRGLFPMIVSSIYSPYGMPVGAPDWYYTVPSTQYEHWGYWAYCAEGSVEMDIWDAINDVTNMVNWTKGLKAQP